MIRVFIRLLKYPHAKYTTLNDHTWQVLNTLWLFFLCFWGRGALAITTPPWNINPCFYKFGRPGNLWKMDFYKRVDMYIVVTGTCQVCGWSRSFLFIDPIIYLPCFIFWFFVAYCGICQCKRAISRLWKWEFLSIFTLIIIFIFLSLLLFNTFLDFFIHHFIRCETY